MALDVSEVATVLSDLTALNFFPADDGGRLAVCKLVGSMASDIGQVRWLVNRMLALFNNYPGPRDLRAVFCSRFRPADGVVVRTCEYFMGPDGQADGLVPAEDPPLIWDEEKGSMVPIEAARGPACGYCRGSGWQIVERSAGSVAAPCISCKGRGYFPLGTPLQLCGPPLQLEAAPEGEGEEVPETAAELKGGLRKSLARFDWPRPAPVKPAPPPPLAPGRRAILHLQIKEFEARLRAARSSPHAPEVRPDSSSGLCVRCWLAVSHPVHL